MNAKEKLIKSIKSYLESKIQNKWTPGKDWIKYAGPYFDDSEYIAGILSLLDDWLVLGNNTLKFEELFPSFLGQKYGILTNSGSSANLLLFAAMQSKNLYNLKKCKVLVPIAGFPTTINPILQLGFEPIFLDIELNTLNLNIDHLLSKLEKNKDARILFFAHAMGNSPNMNIILDIVKKYNLILLEDVCDALGSTFNNIPLGGFGEMATCSFYPAHHITLGEGGFVATNNIKTKMILRSLSEWGRACYCIGDKASLNKDGLCKNRFNNWIPKIKDSIFDHRYVYSEIGYNLRPLELQAAIGIEQLKKIPLMKEIRNKNHKLLYNIFKKYEEFFILPQKTELCVPNWFAFALTVKNNKIKRSNFCKYLEENKIQTRQYFGGNIMMHPAYSEFDINFDEYENANKCMENTFFLGIAPNITEKQIDYIKKMVDKYFDI